MLFDTISYVSGADWDYDIAGSSLSTPADADVIMRFVATRAFSIPANFVGSQFSNGTTPSSTATLTVKKNGSSIGTISVTTGDVATFSSAGTSVAVDDVIELEVTTANGIDAIAFTLKTLAP